MLVLVRHGQTSLNAERRLAGRMDVDLTELGLRQAHAVAAAVGDAGGVITSPLLRARRTAECFGAGAVIDERWIELDYGEYDGCPFEAVPPAFWAAWRSDADLAPPGGESLSAVGRRVRAACEELAERARTIDLVVVSHVSPIKAAVAWALGTGDVTSWRMYLAPASVTRIVIGAHGPSLVTFNDVSHLDRSESG